MNKGIWVIIVAAAFVVGTIASTNVAEAKNENNPDPVAAAIDNLTMVIAETAIQGPQGDQGPQGIQGEEGAVGQAMTQVISIRYASNDEDFDRIQCKSDDDFVVHINLQVGADQSYILLAPGDPENDALHIGATQQSTPDRRTDGYTIGGKGGQRVSVLDGGDNNGGVKGFLSLQTTEDATASCQDQD